MFSILPLSVFTQTGGIAAVEDKAVGQAAAHQRREPFFLAAHKAVLYGDFVCAVTPQDLPDVGDDGLPRSLRNICRQITPLYIR